jgi:hypothetical protein
MPRGLKPLKHDHLHSDDFCAGPSHPPKCDLLAFGTARAHGVADDKDAPAGLDEREHRLQYTDVRLPSPTTASRPGARRSKKSGAPTAPNVILGRTADGSGASSATVGPSPFGFCSVNRTGAPTSPAASTSRRALASGRVVDCWHELRLEVDEKKRRGLGAHDWHGIPSLILTARRTAVLTLFHIQSMNSIARL